MADECLLPDSVMIGRGGPTTGIGMSKIKSRRLALPVSCHPGDTVGDYVPFNFCPRSVMLYVIHMGNSPELAFKGGQGSIVHLASSLDAVIAWANANGVRWAFTPSNAGAIYTMFHSTVTELDQIDWTAVANDDFRSAVVKEGKQAEFLLHGSLPWTLVTQIGVRSASIKSKAEAAIATGTHRPDAIVSPDWYY